MKKISSLLALLLVVSISFTSCSKDEPQETLTVKSNINGTDYEKSFTVNQNSIFQDTEGFIFDLVWTSENNRDVDLDLYTDSQSRGGYLDTGFDFHYSRSASSEREDVTVLNRYNDTYGKTHINVYTSGEDTINYTLTIKNKSNGNVIKTKTGRIQTTVDEASNPNLTNSKHTSTSHGFETIGDFVKVGKKFHFGF